MNGTQVPTLHWKGEKKVTAYSTRTPWLQVGQAEKRRGPGAGSTVSCVYVKRGLWPAALILREAEEKEGEI